MEKKNFGGYGKGGMFSHFYEACDDDDEEEEENVKEEVK